MLGATVAVGAFVACGEDANDLGEPSTRAPDAGPGSDGGAVPSNDAGPIGTASGVVLLHAASFPAFRLCFENYPGLLPQPDQAVMPRANVVGVEVGSVVRIAPLERRPGKVYAFIQSKLPAPVGDPNGRPCGELLRDPQFTRNLEYHEAGELTEPLGVDNVAVLGLTGCGGKAIVEALGLDPADCGPQWDVTSGSLLARTLTLFPSVEATSSSLPVQLVQMSSVLDRTSAAGGHVDVTFGALDASAGERLEQEVATAPPLFAASDATTLALDQTSEATYGTFGFRIALRPNDGGAPSFSVDQSLAEVQDLSSPQTIPTAYFRAASNYALLLLGDPRVQHTFADGGANPAFDPRRAVHLLAIPVREQPDAGEPIAIDDAGSVDR